MPPEMSLLSPSKALDRSVDLPRVVVSGSPPDHAAATVSYGFRVATIRLLISVQTHSEVMEPLPIFPLPNTPPWFLGLSNLRGNIVPVYDLEEIFNIHGDDQEKRYLMVLGKSDKAVGQLIRGLPHQLVLKKEQVMTNQPPLPKRLREFASKVYMIDQQAWVEFDHKRFFQTLVRELASST